MKTALLKLIDEASLQELNARLAFIKADFHDTACKAVVKEAEDDYENALKAEREDEARWPETDKAGRRLDQAYDEAAVAYGQRRQAEAEVERWEAVREALERALEEYEMRA